MNGDASARRLAARGCATWLGRPGPCAPAPDGEPPGLRARGCGSGGRSTAWPRRRRHGRPGAGPQGRARPGCHSRITDRPLILASEPTPLGKGSSGPAAGSKAGVMGDGSIHGGPRIHSRMRGHRAERLWAGPTEEESASRLVCVCGREACLEYGLRRDGAVADSSAGPAKGREGPARLPSGPCSD